MNDDVVARLDDIHGHAVKLDLGIHAVKLSEPKVGDRDIRQIDFRGAKVGFSEGFKITVQVRAIGIGATKGGARSVGRRAQFPFVL